MYVYIDRIWRWMTYKGWYVIKPKQPINKQPFSWIFLVELQYSTFICFYFISWEASFKKRVVKTFCWLKFSCLEFGSQNLNWWSNSNWTKMRKSFFSAALSGITSLFSTPAKSSTARSQLDFFLKMNFYMVASIQHASFYLIWTILFAHRVEVTSIAIWQKQIK